MKRYLDDLYRQSAVATQELQEMTDAIATATGGTPNLPPEPKNRQRAEDKIKGYDGMANELNDLTAGKIEYDTLHDLYDGLAMIKDSPEVSIVNFEDRFVEPQDSGYRDILMNVQMSRCPMGMWPSYACTSKTLMQWLNMSFPSMKYGEI